MFSAYHVDSPASAFSSEAGRFRARARGQSSQSLCGLWVSPSVVATTRTFAQTFRCGRRVRPDHREGRMAITTLPPYPAMASFSPGGKRRRGVDDFVKLGNVIQLGRPPNRIDLLSFISGVEFEDAWASRVHAELDGRRPAGLLPRLAIPDRKQGGVRPSKRPRRRCKAQGLRCRSSSAG